jgi:hypothetical protein
MGISPIQFNSPDVAMKNITTESKVFSIIATGYVKSGKRETRQRIHAVIDMRGAPAPQAIVANELAKAGGGTAGLGNAMGALGLPGAPTPSPAASAAAPGATGPIPGLPAGATVDADLGFLIPDPAGRVIYFRMD